MIPEMTPNEARSIVCGICAASVWAFAFMITLLFMDFQAAVTKAGAFWSFCVITLFSLLFVRFLLPETKGKTIEEISRQFRRDKYELTNENEDNQTELTYCS
jgi:Sugar (and other) transporter